MRVSPGLATSPRARFGTNVAFATHQPGRPARRGSVLARAAANPAGSDKYDYIIVGGGTAGSVLANRLTADGNKKVLVLEAGGNGGALETRAPAGLPRLFKHPTLDWNLDSTKQQILGSREVYLARGKLLGGSSATNATLYVRGAPDDYDAWGLEGWTGSEVARWFVRAENYAGGASKHHGSEGLMRVDQPRYDNPLHEEFFRAAAAAGLPANPDFNNWDRPQEGYGEFQVTHHNGRRADAFHTHLKAALGRPNLKVVTGARTTKVHTDVRAGTPTAAGVEFAVGGRGAERHSAELAPGGEVLMCAGTVGNPQILMLSGVGPVGSLREQGLGVVADVAGVGQNLQDHPATLVASPSKPQYQDLAVTSQVYNKSYNVRLSAILKLLLLGKGPLTTTGCDHGAFVSTTGSGLPDLQIRFVPGFALDPDGIQSYVKFGRLQKEGKVWPGGITMQLLAARPRSRGTVGLASTDPFDLPAVDLKYYTDKDGADLSTLVSGVQLARRIAGQGPLAQYLEPEQWPGAGVSSEEQIRDYVLRTTCSGNALVGTCRMGASASDGSVVSSKDMRVWGVDGLRVVDASVIPTIPGGQTGAATFMIAERTAAAMAAAARSGSSKAGAITSAEPALV